MYWSLEIHGAYVVVDPYVLYCEVLLLKKQESTEEYKSTAYNVHTRVVVSIVLETQVQSGAEQASFSVAAT